LASIHGTVSTILAAVIIAPCSPCMNWLRLALKNSIPSWEYSFSLHKASGDPGSRPASRVTASNGLSCSATRRSGSTSIDQSRSVTLLHCEAIALL
jgi:hypothetical protein